MERIINISKRKTFRSLFFVVTICVNVIFAEAQTNRHLITAEGNTISSSCTRSASELQPGDADGNEFIDPEDVQFTKDFIMTNQGPDGFVRQNADTNGDNEINVIDIVEIVKQIK